jgi:hypothetical protein
MMLRTLLVLLLAATCVDAAVVDRRVAVSPVSSVIDSTGGAVVASDNGMFLAGGQRVSSDGVIADAEPIPEAVGVAVAWHDGWLVLNPHRRPYVDLDSQVHVRHLGASGGPTLTQLIPLSGLFRGAASVSDRLAMLETVESRLRLTIADESRVIRVVDLGGVGAGSGRIARLGDGFIVVAQMTTGGNSRSLWIWVLDREGEVVRTRAIENEGSSDDSNLAIVTGDARALVFTRWSYGIRYRVLDDQLVSTPPVTLEARGNVAYYGLSAFAMDDRFLLSYRFRDSGSVARDEYRARVIRADASTQSDDLAEPIAGGDRSGDRFLVVRPWGDAAIAEGDPRTVVSPAIRLEKRVFEKWGWLRTHVASYTTLIEFSGAGTVRGPRRFVRIDEAGRPIDVGSRLFPSPTAHVSVIPPDGFLFAWREGDDLRVRRLSGRGGWLDPHPVTLWSTPDVYGFAVSAGRDDLLLVWMTRDAGEVLWLRVSHTGTPLQSAPSRRVLSRVDRFDYPSLVIAERDGERAIVVRDTDYCVITCEPPRLKAETFVLDTEGNEMGPGTLVDTRGTAKPVGLPDGTWVLPFRRFSDGETEVLHLERDGTLRQRVMVPALQSETGVGDVVPTQTGWKAYVGYPSRVVEMYGAVHPLRMTGLTLVNPPSFGSGDRLVFLDESPELESLDVPWSARLDAKDGNLSIGLTDLGLDGYQRLVELSVHNKGTRDASGVFATWGSRPTIRFPLLRPRETHRTTSAVPEFGSARIWVLSEDVADTSPNDNVTTAADRP